MNDSQLLCTLISIGCRNKIHSAHLFLIHTYLYLSLRTVREITAHSQNQYHDESIFDLITIRDHTFFYAKTILVGYITVCLPLAIHVYCTYLHFIVQISTCRRSHAANA